MATFYFSNDRVIDLDFCEKYHKQVEVNGDLMNRLKTAGEYISSKADEIKASNDLGVLDTMCDYLMDAIDMILCDGEADKILEQKPGYSVFDVIEVFRYISDEVNKGIEGFASTYGKEAVTPPMNPPMNRAQRRATARHTHEITIPPHNHNLYH